MMIPVNELTQSGRSGQASINLYTALNAQPFNRSTNSEIGQLSAFSVTEALLIAGGAGAGGAGAGGAAGAAIPAWAVALGVQMNVLTASVTGLTASVTGLTASVTNIQADMHNMQARQTNGMATDPSSTIAIVRVAGVAPAPPIVFPQTRRALLNMSLAQVNQHLNFYGIVGVGLLAVRRQQLRAFLGVPLIGTA
jgi:hypothetical protein